MSKIAKAFFNDGVNSYPHASLAFFPGGTGCDYFRYISSGKSWLDLIKEDNRSSVDVGMIELDGKERIIFLNSISFGISASVVRKKLQLPNWLPAVLKYGLPVVGSLLSFRPQPLELIVGGRGTTIEPTILFCSKGKFGGAGMVIGGENSLDSGVVNPVIY